MGGRDATIMVRNVYTRMVSPKLGYLVNLTGHNIKGKLQDSCLLSIVSSKQLNSLQLLLLRVILTVYVVHVLLAFVTAKVRHTNDDLRVIILNCADFQKQ